MSQPSTKLISQTVRFTDDTTIVMRPISIPDGRLLSGFLGQMSPAKGVARGRWVARLINADHDDALVYGAFVNDSFGSSLVAVAESVRSQEAPGFAELTVITTEPWRDLGIGAMLTALITEVAESLSGSGAARGAVVEAV